jgi:hypothetical protein
MIKIVLAEFEELLKKKLNDMKLVAEEICNPSTDNRACNLPLTIRLPENFCQTSSCMGAQALEAKMEERIFETKEAIDKIWAWKYHIVWTFWSDKQRGDLIARLLETEVLIIMDFAQKFLRMKHHESQAEYFSKQGMSWHITVIIMVKDGKISQHTFVHVLRNYDQVIK